MSKYRQGIEDAQRVIEEHEKQTNLRKEKEMKDPRDKKDPDIDLDEDNDFDHDESDQVL